MLALKIIGGVLLLLLLLLLVPVRLEASFREEFSLTLRYLFFKIPLAPGEEKPGEEPAPQEEPEGEEKKEGKDSLAQLKAIVARKGFFGFVQSLLELVGMALRSVGKILSHLKLKRFDLYLCVGGAEDAAAAAVLYGQLCAGVYPACGALFSLMKPPKKGLSLDLDYDRPENLVDFSGELSIRPLFVLGHLLALACRAVPKVLKLMDIHLFPLKKVKTQKKGEVQ